jgi:long-chain acyl-CoA synthetase
MASQITYADKPWLNHYEKGVPECIDYELITLPSYLDNSAKRYPDRTALICEGFKVSYRRLYEMTSRFASCLTAFGVEKGDRVAILLPNLIHSVVSYYATLKVGAVAVMCNPEHSDGELLFQLQDSGAKILVTMDFLADRMIALKPQTDLNQIILASLDDYLPLGRNLLFPLTAGRKGKKARAQPTDNVYRWKNLLTDYSANHRIPGISMDDVAMIQYTGGTTGVAKGVILSHANLSFQTQQIDAWFPQFAGREEKMLGALPFFHSFGLTCSMNLSVFAGWTNILIPAPRPVKILAAIRRYRPTFVPLVPTLFISLLNHPDIRKTPMTSIKGCFSGSAALPLEVIRKFEGLTGAAISEGFGLTEASPITHANPFNGIRKVGSVGLPFPDTDCRIVGLEDGKTDVPMGESGELWVRGPQIMTGYHNSPGETAAALRDGWLVTGDIARMDEDGYFYIVDRKKDMVITRGRHVYPREIEEVLYGHPKIKEACVIGLPHPEHGEQIKAFVVAQKEDTATVEELIAYCRTRLAAYKLPTQFEFRDELPKSQVGKILRNVLRQKELEK